MRKVWLADMRYPEVVRLLERPHVGVLPIGSTEQHGPHLPLDVDTRIAAAMCEAAALQVAEEIGVAIAPPLSIGISEHHMRFPGTLSVVRSQPSRAALVQTGTSLVRHGFDRLAIVNGHAGNVGATRTSPPPVYGSTVARNGVATCPSGRSRPRRSRRCARPVPAAARTPCEYETSVYLHPPTPTRWRSEEAVARSRRPRSARARSTCSRTGRTRWRWAGTSPRAACSATRRSRPPREGRAAFEAAVENLAQLLRDLAG